MLANDETEPRAVRVLRLDIEYDGTAFHGWQVQKQARTVQGELEAAFEHITHEHARFQGAGRTDAGVHARGQVASVRTACGMDLQALGRGLNALTGHDVSVRGVIEAPADFCARRSATSKRYVYRILNCSAPSALRRMTRLHVRSPLEVGSMRAAAAHLVGTHDFDAFRAADCERESAIMRLDELEVRSSGDEVEIEARGPAFLKNMVRIIAGTLVWVGSGRLTPGEVAEILASRDRRLAGPTAPAHGLELAQVFYGASRSPTRSSMP